MFGIQLFLAIARCLGAEDETQRMVNSLYSPLEWECSFSGFYSDARWNIDCEEIGLSRKSSRNGAFSVSLPHFYLLHLLQLSNFTEDEKETGDHTARGWQNQSLKPGLLTSKEFR